LDIVIFVPVAVCMFTIRCWCTVTVDKL